MEFKPTIMKYPRTLYLSFSPSKDNKDVRKDGLFDLNNFIGKDLIITEKMDGSNCQMDCNHIAARNGYDAKHPSFAMAKAIHNTIKDCIPSNIIVFGEWLYATHSIYYNNLNGYYQVFACYNKDTDTWLGIDDVWKIADKLRLPQVPQVIILNPCNNIKLLQEVIKWEGDRVIASGSEGIVIRNCSEFSDFKTNVAKYVRANHVQTDEHWSKKAIERNLLKT